MYENYDDYEEVDLSEKKSFKKYIYIVILIVFVLIVILFFFLNKNKDYSFYEEKMIKKATEYVVDNHISTSKEIFVDISKLDMEIPNNCALTSGVIYNGSTYKSYLACSDYESKIIDNNSTNIQLMGNDVDVILKGMDYVDLGYISKHNVLVNGEVQDEEGVYNIYYVLDNNEVVTRKVIVLDNNNLIKYFPTILLNGEKTVYIKNGNDYQEEGFIAYDSNGNDLRKNVIKTSLVNSNQSGEYKIVYQVKDNKAYTTTIIRKVIVSSESDLDIISSLSTTNVTNKNIKIIINILGNDYSYTVLPNGEEEKNKMFSYEVLENGTYNFKIVTNSDEIISKEVVVNNIDKEAPKFSCEAQVGSKTVDIKVTKQDNKVVTGYYYIIDGVTKNFSVNDTYSFSKFDLSSIEVKAEDNLGNSGTTSCSIKQLDPSIGNHLVKYYIYNNTEYVIANTLNNLDDFQNRTCRKLAQVVDQANCGDACLSFALYYAAYIQKGNLSQMNQYAACNYNYGNVAKFRIVSNSTKEQALKTVYDELQHGKVSVLQVTGTKTRDSRHFILIVGYKREKYYAEDLTEEDLLGIDSWNGCFVTISYNDTSKRTMFDNKDGNGYRVDIIK